MKVTFDDREAQRKINSLINGLGNFRQPLAKVRDMQMKEIDEAFNVAGKNITGSSWKSLNPNYLKSKLKAGFQSRILERTGKMRKKFKQMKLTKTILNIGNLTNYFGAHQKGYKKIPQRQMLGHSRKMIDNAVEIMHKYLFGLLKK